MIKLESYKIMRIRSLLPSLRSGTLFLALAAMQALTGTAQAQSISGTLHDAGTGTPLGNAVGQATYGIIVYNADGGPVASLYTAPDGTYQTIELLPGPYYVKGFDTSLVYVTELYNDFPCIADDCVVSAGTPVVLSSGPVVVNIALARAGRFTGTVRQTAGGTPLAGVGIRVYNAAGSFVRSINGGSTTTGVDGGYAVDGLAPGTYFARTEAVLSGLAGSPNVVDELYGGLSCPRITSEPECRVTDGAPIMVTAGATTPWIDFSLEPGGSISGRVTDATGQTLNGVRVAAYIGDVLVGLSETSVGQYVISALPPGTYSVRASYFDGNTVPEWYDNKCVACGDRPTPVVVTAGVTTPNVDFALSAGGAIEGTITFTQPTTGPFLGPPSILVYNAAGVLVETMAFSVDGPGPPFNYRVGGLAPGTYYVRTWSDAFPSNVLHVPPRITPAYGRLVGELFDNIVCVAADCRPTSGRPIAVAAGQATRNVDFALDVGATITGFGITSFNSPVEVFDARGVALPKRHELFGNAIVGLPAGAYYLRKARDASSAELLYEFIDDCPACPPTVGTPVVVALGQNRTDINFGIFSGRAIRGIIRDATTALPLSNIVVEAYAADGRLIGSERSSIGGQYALRRLGPGTYYLRTVNTRNYVDEVYNNVVCPSCSPTMGTPVAVSRGSDTNGIDFGLASGTPLGGVVRADDGFVLPGSRVSIFDASGTLSGRATASALGRFTTTLPDGAYRARSDALPGYVQELFDNVPCAQGQCDVTTGAPIAIAGTPVTSVNFSLAACAAPVISPLRLATGAVGVIYRQTFGAGGGTPPRRFVVVSGLLPPGLMFDGATGVLAGTPTAPGSYAVTVGVTDATGCSGTRGYVIDIQPCAFILDSQSASLRASGEPWLIRIADACGQWSVRTDASWLSLNLLNPPPRLAVVAAPNPGPGPRRGTILIGPRVFTVNQAAPEATPPFGFLDAPLDGSQVDGSIAIGGWALDDLGVFEVRVYRNAVSPEPPGGRVFLGKGVFVENARPDIERAYPSYPNARRAGWGFMLLTNMLPQQGNGTFEISAYAVDADLTESLLGRRTIVVNNATAILPFGAIDTPAQGETIFGASYMNFGWALTPQPKAIPVDGSTFQVYVDGVALGPVTYNAFRSDIATLFPGYANSGGAVGYRVLDTTTLDEGLHTIAWTVVDNLGAAAGIGSRYFSVSNSAPGTASSFAASSFAAGVSAALRSQVGSGSAMVPARVDGIDIGRRSESLALLPADETGTRRLRLSPLERVTLTLESESTPCPATWAGYHVVAGETRGLPVGSALDPTGTFYWQPGPAFVGTYEFVFVRTGCEGDRRRVPVRIRTAD